MLLLITLVRSDHGVVEAFVSDVNEFEVASSFRPCWRLDEEFGFRLIGAMGRDRG